MRRILPKPTRKSTRKLTRKSTLKLTMDSQLQQTMSKFLSHLTDTNVLYKNVVYNKKEYPNKIGLDVEDKSGWYKDGIEMFIHKGDLIIKSYTVWGRKVCLNFSTKINYDGTVKFCKINFFGLGIQTHKNSEVVKSDYEHIIGYLNEIDERGLKEKELKLKTN